MRRSTYVLCVLGAGVGLSLFLGPDADAGTPRTPDRPRVPRSKQVDPQPVVQRRAMRGGLLSLGTLERSAPRPTATQQRRRPRTTSSQVSRRASQPVVHRSVRSGSDVAQRIADAWPGDDGQALHVASCESNFNAGATSSSGRYRGLFQFDAATWRSVGGRGSPEEASVEEQTRRAWRLRQQRGWDPWPVCGRHA